MTLTEAARFIRVSEKTLGEMARKGRIPCQKVGRAWRFLRSAIEEWLACKGEIGTGHNAVRRGRGIVREPLVQYELPFPGFRDTAFTENVNCALHRWVPWIAGFSASFVEGVLDKVGRRGRRLKVLDPFAGVGTTLVAALKEGHDALGFEINPYAALACAVKTKAASYDVKLLREKITLFEEYGIAKSAADGERPRSLPPKGFVTRVPFFSPKVERQVLFCLDFIAEETVDWIRGLFRVALGSVLVSFSNYSYEPSLGTRAGAGKPNIEEADVFGIVGAKLHEMAEDISVFQDWMEQFSAVPKARVFLGSYFELVDEVERRSVDVLVTSPPYLNNYHYIRNTRPQMYWLGMVQSPAELKKVEGDSFGRFWQTVRSGPDIALKPDVPELARLIEQLRHRNTEKGAYGGQGWANYAACYFNDCDRFCDVTLDLLKPGGTAVIVIGNNILQGIEFQTDRFFAEIARKRGFDIIQLHRVRKKRTGSSIVNSSVRSGAAKKKTTLYETAVEMRAP